MKRGVEGSSGEWPNGANHDNNPGTEPRKIALEITVLRIGTIASSPEIERGGTFPRSYCTGANLGCRYLSFYVEFSVTDGDPIPFAHSRGQHVRLWEGLVEVRLTKLLSPIQQG